MKCANCGYENKASSKFCEECGRALVQKQNQTWKSFFIYFVPLLAIILCVVAFSIIKVQKNKHSSNKALLNVYTLGSINDISERYQKWLVKLGHGSNAYTETYTGDISDVERTVIAGDLVMEYCNDKNSPEYMNAKSAIIILNSSEIIADGDIAEATKVSAFINTFLFDYPDEYSISDIPEVINKSFSVLSEIDKEVNSQSNEINHIYTIEFENNFCLFYCITDTGKLVISYY